VWLIDRYIVRRFLANFFILLILLFVFAVSIDLLLELDEFVEVARDTVGPEGGFLAQVMALIGVVAHFHGPRLFQFYAYMLGLLSVGAMGFTLAQMHRHRELVALLASGVRLHRIALPILSAALGAGQPGAGAAPPGAVADPQPPRHRTAGGRSVRRAVHFRR
jgi:lipopolysaccharide export LptBFGC system permease protein LptF